MITGMFAAPVRPRSALRTKRTASTATRTTERHHTLLAEYTAFSRPPPPIRRETRGWAHTVSLRNDGNELQFLGSRSQESNGNFLPKHYTAQCVLAHTCRTLSPNTGHTPETGRVTSIKTEFDAFTRTAHRGLIGKTSLQVCVRVTTTL